MGLSRNPEQSKNAVELDGDTQEHCSTGEKLFCFETPFEFGNTHQTESPETQPEEQGQYDEKVTRSPDQSYIAGCHERGNPHYIKNYPQSREFETAAMEKAVPVDQKSRRERRCRQEPCEAGGGVNRVALEPDSRNEKAHCPQINNKCGILESQPLFKCRGSPCGKGEQCAPDQIIEMAVCPSVKAEEVVVTVEKEGFQLGEK